MENKIIKTGDNVQAKIISGVDKAVTAIVKTLGPSGRNVAFDDQSGFGVMITRDGATVAKNIKFSDQEENYGAELVKKAASMTEDKAGDGPQPLYARVLTPNGWTTMGELKVGDEICGTNGSTQTVVGTYAKGEKEIYRLTFANGQVVECCEDHLWNITTKGGTSYRTMPLKEIIRIGISYCDLYTPKTFVDFPERDLSIDPFLVGLVIGGGCLNEESGSIELVLAENKISVMDEVTGIEYSVDHDEDNHCYRVKFDQGTLLDDYIKPILSVGRSIPIEYLYSSKKQRERLLAGFANSGYTNAMGLLNYSTTSIQLYEDLVELMEGLGKTIQNHSEATMHHISQLQEDECGTKLVGIEKTGEYTKMMCIKVSNPDNLYITNDYIVTHNTSTTSLLIKEFCKKGQKAVSNGANVNELKAGMLKAGKWLTEYIKNNAIEIDGDLEKIRKVATISANNDPEVGDLIVKAFQSVGLNGLVTAETSSSLDTTIDITTGMKLDRGWASPQYVTNPEDGQCVMEDPYILVAGERISSVAQLMNLLQDFQTNSAGRPLLIVCDDMDETVNAMFVFNTLRGAIRCCVIKGIDFGDNRKNTMEDIATMVGATHICQENGVTVGQATMADLGQAKKVVVGRDSCIIYEGHGNPQEIAERAEVLKKRMESPQTTDYDRTKFEKRVANLTGGIAVIKAGGASEAETANRKATIEDSILAAKSAIEEGCAPGGGYIFFKASKAMLQDKNLWKNMTEDEKEGAMIIQKSLPVVLRTIAENAGYSGEVVIAESSRVKKEGIGFNAKTKKFEDLVESGVLDSAKVLRVSLENSISTASMILLIDCTITNEEKKECAATE